MNITISAILLMAYVKWTTSYGLLGARALGKMGFGRRTAMSISQSIFSPVDSFNKSDKSTVDSLYKLGYTWLEKQGVPDPAESSRHLLMHCANLGTRYSDFQRNSNTILTLNQIESFEILLKERVKRVPVQYLVGNWDFYGLHIVCQPPILIPRPETEELVEKAVRDLKRLKSAKSVVLDVGCGTGAIGIAIASEMTNTQITAIDINSQAIELSTKNAEINLRDYCRYTAIHSDFLSFAQRKEVLGMFDVIVSNPPYIPTSEMSGLQDEVQLYEDHGALDGGLDGLDIILQLIEYGSRLLSREGSRMMWLEVDTSHPTKLKQLFCDNIENRAKYSIETIDCYNDLSGNPRFVRVTYM